MQDALRSFLIVLSTKAVDGAVDKSVLDRLKHRPIKALR